MAPTKVVVDPITRIEGHLRIEAQAENGRITDAWASSTQFRGIEIIMQGRDPRDAWAFTQRICGVCTVVHAVARCRAVEDALDIRMPPNANTIRNLIHGMQFIQDHVIHFYHLHALDWVDVVSALDADPAATAPPRRHRFRPGPTTRRPSSARCRSGSSKFVKSGQLGIFTNGYWGHPAYKLPPEVNLHGGRALPRGARLAARCDPPAHGLRRQESASQLPGRRDGLRHQPRGHRRRSTPSGSPTCAT